MAEVVEEKTHALLSPSGAHRWVRCPGSVVLEAGNEDTGSVHARWGSCAHEVAALILQELVDVKLKADPTNWDPENAEKYVGRVFQIEGHDVEFDMEMADCVNDYVAHVESFWEPGDIMLVEQAVPLEQITGEKGATGTSDCVIIKPARSEIVVIDLKGGRGVQVYAEADEDDNEGEPLLNEQGAMYGDGTVEEHGILYGPFDTVRIVIIQPRLNHVDEVAASAERLDRNIAAIRATCAPGGGVNEALAMGSVGATPAELLDAGLLTPGEKQCKFCSAKATCPALEGAVSDALRLTAPPARADEFPDLSPGKQAAAAIPETMADIDHERLAKAWKAIPLIEQWVGAVRDAVHARLHDGAEVGDLCLYEGKQGARGWSDEAEAEALLKKSRVKSDEMYTKKLLTYPAAEKAFKGNKTLWAKLAPLVDRPDGKPVVGVKGDADRTPWSPAKPEEFPDLDAGDEDDIFG